MPSVKIRKTAGILLVTDSWPWAATKSVAAWALLANQFQHVPAPLGVRPPDRVVPGVVMLQAKLRIVLDQRAHCFDAADGSPYYHVIQFRGQYETEFASEPARFTVGRKQRTIEPVLD